MAGQYNVIQAPKSFNSEDLPDEICVDEPFKINGNTYVLVKCEPKQLEVCEVEGENTGIPESISSFYTIKKLGDK